MTKPEKWILLGIPVLFLLGGFLHFAYKLSGNNLIVGMVTPVNESVFEHTKLVLPIILWWGIYYIVMGDKYAIDKSKWFQACVVSLVCAIIVIPVVFYLYRGALGVESVIFDILILFIALAVGQLIGLYVYRNGKGWDVMLSTGIILLIVILYVFFTFFPPHLPIFMDSNTGKYGIMSK